MGNPYESPGGPANEPESPAGVANRRTAFWAWLVIAGGVGFALWDRYVTWTLMNEAARKRSRRSAQ